MNRYRQTLALLLTAIFFTVASASAKPKTIDAPSKKMTVGQARKALEESLNHLLPIGSVQELKINHHGFTFVAHGKNASISFADMKNLSAGNVGTVKGDRFSVARVNKKYLNLGPAGPAYFDNEDSVIKFIDAVLTLKEAALAPDTEEVDFAAFTVSAKTWLATTPKPEMSDDARAYKALAEDAFKRKDFPAALDAYCNALEKYPMWPSGHYNAALLAAEAEDYELAAQHMRRYLVLSPDAKDAQAAKDKLLLWQHKAKE